ncbi:winged helix-turn-helix domain-containing protein [Prolixibacteraceae bacterium Z1-6]|uniref:Winged helix-turn-helix domain-containing protein n=1 Tax=Draconibacterium aestuarii TaxID=2998507 RepID=A0A9X3J4Y2_9BACT|nr:winged helix-turn-helix domain-containing protein [Prolixibacteraceae bacterium Z1-6]
MPFLKAADAFIECNEKYKQEWMIIYVHVDFKKFQAFVGKTEVSLLSKEIQILKHMVEHEGEAIHRHDLLNNVWGYEAMPSTRTVDNFILDLQKN